VFIPLHRTRSIDDWFRPLDGCPRCGYAYEREEGYFLLATWGVNYGVVAGLGVGLALLVEAVWSPPLWVLICGVLLPMPLVSMLVARHAKSLFLAMDHYFDPHVGKAAPTPPPPPHPSSGGDMRRHKDSDRPW
jgi:uncharacterized protein (DUF983 family)